MRYTWMTIYDLCESHPWLSVDNLSLIGILFLFFPLTLLACLKIIEKRVKITIFYMLYFKILN